MKKFILTLFAAACVLGATAKKPATPAQSEGYRFTDREQVAATSVKDQSRSGTCWSFAGLGFLEGEILLSGGEPVDLSEMWIVRNAYLDKAEKYVRMQGYINFGPGGATHDVFNTIERYGIVPEEVYPGLNYGTANHNHSEVDAALLAYLDAVIKRKSLTTAWKAGVEGILDAYFGPKPETFTYKGKEYTPASFAASLPVKLDDYVSFTSFTHHPFYTRFALEVPDNWAWGDSWNVPLEELMAIIEASLDAGRAVDWAADVSEKGFSRPKAIAVVPVEQVEGLEGTEAERWDKLTQAEKDAAIYALDEPGREKSIDQRLRQQAFDNYETTDDHLMVIVGRATDQKGNPYYKVKNSWGVRGPYDGYYYFSVPYVAYKTLNLVVNKHTLPAAIRQKCGID